MADQTYPDGTFEHGGEKEAVCIDAFRVYDSCGDKDCLEDLKVMFCESAQCIIDRASNVRIRDVDVICVYIDLEPVPFHKGFYSVDMTFYFEVELDVFTAPAAMPLCVKGLSIYNKKVILYGSEGNVKIFSSDFRLDDPDIPNAPAKNLPKASVQVAKPIGLSAKLCRRREPCVPCCRIPGTICERFGGALPCDKGEKDVFVTIGIFTIVQIERNVQMLVPTYDFCVPEKECKTSSDSPCEMFSRLDFPTDEFFPPRVTDINDDCGCCKPKG
ncbi:MAG: hypothetical protein ACI4I4_05670 [Acutalibacteraceae bacterium]